MTFPSLPRVVLLAFGLQPDPACDYTTLQTIQETGGVRLDAFWEENLTAAHVNAHLAHTLGISLVTLHAGFMPHDRDDPVRAVMIRRLREIVDAFAARDRPGVAPK